MRQLYLCFVFVHSLLGGLRPASAAPGSALSCRRAASRRGDAVSPAAAHARRVVGYGTLRSSAADSTSLASGRLSSFFGNIYYIRSFIHIVGALPPTRYRYRLPCSRHRCARGGRCPGLRARMLARAGRKCGACGDGEARRDADARRRTDRFRPVYLSLSGRRARDSDT